MKKIFKRTSCMLLVMLVILASIGTGTAYAATVNITFGPSVTGVLNTVTGDLVISGTGNMANFDAFQSPIPPANRSVTKNVIINNGVTSIGNNAFAYCSGLISITIPGSVTSIGDSAFSGCSGLKIVTISEGMTSIGAYAFGGCSGLTSITIPSSVSSIGNNAFFSCSGLTSITIPNSVTSIEKSVFDNCPSLTSVTIPSSVTSIGERAFAFCSGLTSITIPSSVASIGDSAFRGTGLTNITIPSSVASIGSSVFQSCAGLTSITIPSSVTSIGNSAFESCTGLTSITIPGSVTSIGESAFRSSGLTNIIISNGVTSIGNSAFRNIAGLTSVTISNSVTSIGDYAFSGCTNLTNITIPSSVASIGVMAFWSCPGIDTIINHYDGVQTIGASAFLGVGSSAQTKNAYLMDANTSFAESMLSLGFTLNTILPSHTGAGSVETTLPLSGTIDALLMSVTHPASIEYTINPDLGYGGAFIAPDITITNNTLVPINVTVKSITANAGGTAQFTDVAPGAKDWARLNSIESKGFIALGLRIADDTGWRAGFNESARYAADEGDTLFGTISTGDTASISLKAYHGLAFNQNLTAGHDITFMFALA